MTLRAIRKALEGLQEPFREIKILSKSLQRVRKEVRERAGDPPRASRSSPRGPWKRSGGTRSLPRGLQEAPRGQAERLLRGNFHLKNEGF